MIHDSAVRIAVVRQLAAIGHKHDLVSFYVIATPIVVACSHRAQREKTEKPENELCAQVIRSEKTCDLDTKRRAPKSHGERCQILVSAFPTSLTLAPIMVL